MDCTLITLALGKSAQDLRELRDRLSDVPAGSLDHHFQQALLRHTFDDPEYRNDFALWARRQLHDFQLAEMLDVIDPLDYENLEDLRQRLLDVIEDRLADLDHVPSVAPGREFHFLRSQILIFGTGLSAAMPGDLANLIPRLSTGSVFYHFVEARRRHPARLDDISVWLEGWGEDHEPTRRRLGTIDFNLWTLTEMRDLIAACFEGPPRQARAG
jgi:hypothetical protein